MSIKMQDQITQATQLLNEGHIVGIPTETVYGLAARIDQEDAIKKIFTTKERPFFDPLIVHVASIEQAQKLVQIWPNAAAVLAKTFWPGPLTLVLPKNEKVSSLITSGLQTVGLRMPKHPMALQLIKEVGCPLAAPSANKFGKTSPTNAKHVAVEFARENVFVLDGGECEVGLESTVLLIESVAAGARLSILREGFVTKSKIESTLVTAGISFEFFQANKTASPGHMKHHYMPSIPFVLLKNNSTDIKELKKEILLKISELPEQIEEVKILKPTQIEKLVQLNLSSDPVLAAREFYAKLRLAAETGADLIYFVMHENFTTEPWLALQDRMTKAASLII